MRSPWRRYKHINQFLWGNLRGAPGMLPERVSIASQHAGIGEFS